MLDEVELGVVPLPVAPEVRHPSQGVSCRVEAGLPQGFISEPNVIPKKNCSISKIPSDVGLGQRPSFGKSLPRWLLRPEIFLARGDLLWQYLPNMCAAQREFCSLNLHESLMLKALKTSSKRLTPRPPSDVGRHTCSHPIQCVRRLSLVAPQKNRASCCSRSRSVPFVGSMAWKMWSGIASSVLLIRVSLPPNERWR